MAIRTDSIEAPYYTQTYVHAYVTQTVTLDKFNSLLKATKFRS